MSFKKKSMTAGLISAAIIIPASTGVVFANGNNDKNLHEKNIDYRNVTGNNVNFRKGPGTNYISQGKLNKGDRVEYLETIGSWIKVKFNAKEGFIHCDYISNSLNYIESNRDDSIKYEKVVTGNRVNFRKGPGINYSIITSLNKGSKIGYISEGNGWTKISYNGEIGYMSSDYLGNTRLNNVVNNSENNEDNSVKSEKQVTGSRVNFRKGPGTNYSVITSLNKGIKVGYISSNNGWTKISYNGEIGYMSSDYLGNTRLNNVVNNSENNEDNNVKSEKQVTGNRVNFREGSGTNYSIITSLIRGTRVGYISESNGWIKANYNGKIGYISANYVGDVDSKIILEKPSSSQSVDAILSLAKEQLGKTYVWGAQGPNNFDCSGFTLYVFKNAAGKNLPRVSKEQSKFGQFVDRSNLQKGDLIFFDTDKDGEVNHVGIYIGNNEFIHASSGGRKIIISQLNNYYSFAYTNARRVL